jgi:hypothetical protein
MLKEDLFAGVVVLGFCGMTVQARAQLPGTWQDADLTALGGGPLAVGVTIALLYDPVYRVIRSHHLAADGHVHELYLDASGWQDADLTALGGGPLTLAGPIATVFDPSENVIRSHHLAADGHVHGLYLLTAAQRA